MIEQLDETGFIVSDTQILGGAPVIRGTRMLADGVRRRIDAGDTFERLERERPDVPREAFRAAYAYATSIEGDHPCPVLNCRGLDELGNCPMGYTRSCMARVKAMQELAESVADPEDL
jgi:uncharacterized protein (DUF433 family)